MEETMAETGQESATKPFHNFRGIDRYDVIVYEGKSEWECKKVASRDELNKAVLMAEDQISQFVKTELEHDVWVEVLAVKKWDSGQEEYLSMPQVAEHLKEFIHKAADEASSRGVLKSDELSFNDVLVKYRPKSARFSRKAGPVKAAKVPEKYSLDGRTSEVVDQQIQQYIDWGQFPEVSRIENVDSFTYGSEFRKDNSSRARFITVVERNGKHHACYSKTLTDALRIRMVGEGYWTLDEYYNQSLTAVYRTTGNGNYHRIGSEKISDMKGYTWVMQDRIRRGRSPLFFTIDRKVPKDRQMASARS